MASSDIDVMNRALQKLGADPITSINQNTKSARAMNVAYDVIRDAELRRHRWKFSITRTALQALATPPVNGIYQNQFQLPSNCLRVLEVGDYWPGADTSDYRNRSVAEWQLEGRQILTNIGAPLSLRYIQQITDAGLFDSCFVETFAARLAMETCEQITQSMDKRKAAKDEYKQALMEGIEAGALETVPEFSADGAWVMERLQ